MAEKTVQSGDTLTVPGGDTQQYSLLDAQGTVDVDGTLVLTGGFQIAGDYLPADQAAITLTPRTLSLSATVDRADLSTWRQYDRSGDINVSPGFGGSYRAVDRGGRAGPIAVEPPSDWSPPFDQFTGFVTSYQESQAGPNHSEIDLTVQRESNRGFVFNTLSQPGEFEFDVERGTVGLDGQQVGQVEQSGTTAGAQHQLVLRLDDGQAAALVDSWGYPAGVVERGVGDAENETVDESPDSRQTVTVSGPAEAQLPDGTYYVTGWSLAWRSYTSRRWQMNVTLAE